MTELKSKKAETIINKDKTNEVKITSKKTEEVKKATLLECIAQRNEMLKEKRKAEQAEEAIKEKMAKLIEAEMKK